MWGLLYLGLLALAAGGTYLGLVDQRRMVVPSGVAGATFAVLSLTPEVVVGTSSGSTTIGIGPERFLFIALSLLTTIWLIGVVLGIFPEDELEDADNVGQGGWSR